MPNGRLAVLPAESTEYLAAAMCFLIAADPASLDPDGELADNLWPWPHLSTFEPRPDQLQNLQVASRYLTRAAGLTRPAPSSEGVGA